MEEKTLMEFKQVHETMIALYREPLNEFYAHLTDIRRKYRETFVDVANMGLYALDAPLFFTPTEEGLQITYEAHYASGIPYMANVTMENPLDVKGEILRMENACEKSFEASRKRQAAIDSGKFIRARELLEFQKGVEGELRVLMAELGTTPEELRKRA